MSNDPKEVVDSAMKFELEGRGILSESAEKATHPLSKATFQFLADQELKHIEIIKAYAETVAASGEFDASGLSVVTKQQAGEQIKGLFAKFQSEFEATAGKEEERLEIYDVGMNMERYGHDFYKAAAAQATDPTAKKFYEFLAAEEIRHFEMIQDTRDFLAQPDAFQAIDEHWMTL